MSNETTSNSGTGCVYGLVVIILAIVLCTAVDGIVSIVQGPIASVNQTQGALTVITEVNYGFAFVNISSHVEELLTEETDSSSLCLKLPCSMTEPMTGHTITIHPNYQVTVASGDWQAEVSYPE